MNARRILRCLRLAIAVAALSFTACSGDDDDVTPAVCTGLGDSCRDTPCAEGFSCSASGDYYVCTPERDGCGGFIGAPCAEGFSCEYLTDSEVGICVTADELACICAEQPDAVGGC